MGMRFVIAKVVTSDVAIALDGVRYPFYCGLDFQKSSSFALIVTSSFSLGQTSGQYIVTDGSVLREGRMMSWPGYRSRCLPFSLLSHRRSLLPCVSPLSMETTRRIGERVLAPAS